MKIKYLVLFILLLSVSFTARGQPSSRVDSLVQRLAIVPADTSRVLLLSQLTEQLCTANATQSLRYGQQGLRLARRLRYGNGEVLMLNKIGTTYFFGEDLSRAARYYQQAVRRAATVPQTGRLLTLALLGLGRVAVMQHDYPESQRYFRQAMRRLQQHLHPVLPKDISMAQNNIGVMYYDWMNSGQAYPDSVSQLVLYYNRLALKTLRRGAADASLAVGLNGMGNVHRLLKNYDSTEYYHRAALELFQRAASPYDVAQTQVWLGAALVAQHRSSEALPLLRTAQKAARRLHLPALRADCCVELAAALAEAGQGTAAYRLARAGQDLLDSLQRADENANLTRLRVQFDTEQERGRVRELTHRTQLQSLQAHRQQQYFWWLASFLLAVAAGLVLSGRLAWRLRRQRIALTSARAEQDRLYALIAHDLRGPVLAFSGLADLLTTYVERQDTARLLGLGGRVRQAAEGLRDLLDNLLNWALAQRGELQLVLEPLPVAALLAEIDRLYQPTADMAGVELLVTTADMSQVLADRQMTLTILRNLVSNALHATPAGGRITVRALATSTPQLLLEIMDTGQGMSAEHLARLMSGQVPPTEARYRGRAGLGMRLSRLFAQAQGGHLTLRSALGEGTTATLALPCASPPLGAPAYPPKTGEES